MPTLIRRARNMLVVGVLGGGFYLLLIDTDSLVELYVLAGVAVACGVAFQLAREQGLAEAKLEAATLLRLWRVALRIPLDLTIVCLEAFRQLVRPQRVRGEFRAVPYRASDGSPQHVARRALSEVAGSVAPNTIIVGVDAERELLLVHQLRRQGHPSDLDPLRLG